VLAGGSRERLLILPPPASFPSIRPIRHVAGYSRVETFPGAACYPMMGCATIFSREHAGDSATVKSGSPPGAGSASPQSVICHLASVIFLLPLPGIERIP